MFDSDVGTIQGSVLGPILYALFVSLLFDLTQLTNFAYDNFYLEWNTNLAQHQSLQMLSGVVLCHTALKFHSR